LLQVDVLDVQRVGGKIALHARSQFRTLDSGVWMKKPGDQEPQGQVQKVDPDGKQIEFTISPERLRRENDRLGFAISRAAAGLATVVARFATAWTLPQDGVKLGEKWKSQQPESGGARSPASLGRASQPT